MLEQEGSRELSKASGAITSSLPREHGIPACFFKRISVHWFLPEQCHDAYGSLSSLGGSTDSVLLLFLATQCQEQLYRRLSYSNRCQSRHKGTGEWKQRKTRTSFSWTYAYCSNTIRFLATSSGILLRLKRKTHPLSSGPINAIYDLVFDTWCVLVGF